MFTKQRLILLIMWSQNEISFTSAFAMEQQYFSTYLILMTWLWHCCTNSYLVSLLLFILGSFLIKQKISHISASMFRCS